MSLSSQIGQEALERIEARIRPARRLVGRLALAIQRDDAPQIRAALNEALGWPEANPLQQFRKASLLFVMTSLLAQARLSDLALGVAPMIPLAPGMAQVLVFSTRRPQQTFCWRVTPAYALAGGRLPSRLPVEPLAQAYRKGYVDIDHDYLRRRLLPRRDVFDPILLIPHPLGMTQIDDLPYVILDGNHRVVCAWQQGRPTIHGFVLTEREARAVLLHHSQWPPYWRSTGRLMWRGALR